MALISMDEAAARIRAPRETVEEWARLGLLTLRAASPTLEVPSGEQSVDEEELADVAERMGWWEVTAESWEHQEDE